jgi:16S rRNA (cytosine1402-N4)-methyltransferase
VGWGFSADVVVADLGFSSNQMENPARGFSFRGEGPLDMRLDPGQRTTAADIIARSSEKELADLIFHLGEEPLARRIAGKLAHARKERPIDTTGALAALVREAYGPRARASRMDPATRTFMALRIAVNNELGALESLLRSIERGAEQVTQGSTGWLNAGARIGIVSFHSLEDRMVKRVFANLIKGEQAERITKKPVTAGEEEMAANPRARSAKLRVIRIKERHTD